jgi:hypothetical protein
MFWTAVMKRLFGVIDGTELTVTWIVSVFGTWLMLVIPFMRKKEQIWKRLNTDQERAVDAWLLGMGSFLGFLALSSLFWSWHYREELHSSAGLNGAWAKAVAGSWLGALIPLLVYLYKRADAIFLDASARQGFIRRYRTAPVTREKRLLAPSVAARLKEVPETLQGGHVVTARLKNGQTVENVFVYGTDEILGVYDREVMGFAGADVVAVEPVDMSRLPAYEESRWLRVDTPS